MRFMIIVKSTGGSEAGVVPEESLMGAMAAYDGELMKAGVLRAASGLKATSRARRSGRQDPRDGCGER